MSKDRALQPQDLELEHWSQGSFYEGKDASLGRRLGLTRLGISYSEVPPGKSGCPFHNHHVEDELFVIIEGQGTYRIGDRKIPVSTGHVLGAPAGGPDTAHQLINTGSGPLRYLSISSKAATEICEYPDSGKFLARTVDPATGETRFRQMVSELESIDYWHREPGA
nr:cupin domain-containing protein [uncultured Gellertiella sp.]